MSRAYTSSVIPAPAANVWRVVRDFNGLAKWTGFVTDSQIENMMRPDQVGCIRAFRLSDGGFIREKLLALSDYDMSCTYSILDSPMAVTDYIATLSLTPITDGNATFAEWQADFDCPPDKEQDLIRHIGGNVFQSAFTALKRQLSGR
jgi:Polyketide cyclase / dehydrase and lipid transport